MPNSNPLDENAGRTKTAIVVQTEHDYRYKEVLQKLVKG